MWYISTVRRQHRNEKKKKKISRIFCQHKISSLLVNCKRFTHIYTLGKLFQSGFFKFCFCFSYLCEFYILSLHNVVSLHVKFCREIAGNLDFRFFVHKHIFLCSFFFFPRKLPKFKYLWRYKLERIATVKEPKKFKKVQNKERHRKTDWNKIIKGKKDQEMNFKIQMLVGNIAWESIFPRNWMMPTKKPKRVPSVWF